MVRGPPQKIRGPPGNLRGPPGNLRGPPGKFRGTSGADLRGTSGVRGLVGTTSGAFLGCQRHFSFKNHEFDQNLQTAAQCVFLRFFAFFTFFSSLCVFFSAFVRINALALSGLFVQVPGTGTRSSQVVDTRGGLREIAKES